MATLERVAVCTTSLNSSQLRVVDEALARPGSATCGPRVAASDSSTRFSTCERDAVARRGLEVDVRGARLHVRVAVADSARSRCCVWRPG